MEEHRLAIMSDQDRVGRGGGRTDAKAYNIEVRDTWGNSRPERICVNSDRK